MPSSRRPLLVLAVLGLASTSLLVMLVQQTTASAQPTKTPNTRQLIQNPGFERGLQGHPWMPSGWDTTQFDQPTVFFGRDTFLVHSGRWAASVANMSTTFPVAHNWHQAILVNSEHWNKTAVFRVWTRSNGLDGRAFAMVQAYQDTASKMARIFGVDRQEALRRLGINAIDDPLLDIGWGVIAFDDPLTEWVMREVRTYVPYGTNMIFVRCGVLGSGQVLFDDASLSLEPPTARSASSFVGNLFRDPGFEQRALAWDISIPPYEGARVQVDSSVSRSGRASILIRDFHDGLVEARIGVAQSFDGRALRNKRVRVSAWFKGDSLRSTCYVKMTSHGLRSRVRHSPAGELLSGTWDWKSLSMEFDVPEDSELVWASLYVTAPARGQVWIDDASFEVIGPARTARPAATPKR